MRRLFDRGKTTDAQECKEPACTRPQRDEGTMCDVCHSVLAARRQARLADRTGYEVRCFDCETVETILEGFADRVDPLCQKCGSQNVQKWRIGP